ncbi:MAG: hypothetical protein Q8R29_00005, partial [bacterium]|nr:hypothetical protein [bacterium]
YDPFSAETLKILPPPHPSYKSLILETVHKKFCVSADKVKQMLKEEEEGVIFHKEPARSAQSSAVAVAPKKEESNAPAPLI